MLSHQRARALSHQRGRAVYRQQRRLSGRVDNHLRDPVVSQSVTQAGSRRGDLVVNLRENRADSLLGYPAVILHQGLAGNHRTVHLNNQRGHRL